MDYPATDKYDEAGFAPPLTPGNYKVKLSAVHFHDRDKKPLVNKDGFAYARFDFDVSEFPGNKLFHQFCFDEDNPYASIQLGKFKQFQVACGINTTTGGDLVNLIDMVCMVAVTCRENKGKIYNNIQSFFVPDETQDTSESFEPDDDEVRF